MKNYEMVYDFIKIINITSFNDLTKALNNYKVKYYIYLLGIKKSIWHINLDWYGNN